MGQPMNLRFGLIACALVLSPATAATTQPQGAAYDRAMENLGDTILGQAVRDGRTSGAVIAFVRDGQVRFAKGYGIEAPGTRVAVRPDVTLFPIASITKTFTAVQVARLKLKGGIRDYDDPANRYLQDVRLPSWGSRQVTIRDLFTQTSGLDESMFDRYRGTPPKGPFSAAALQASMPVLFRRPGDFPAYSNYGIDVLGALVSNVERIGYVEGVTRDILRPLGMASSGFITDGRRPKHLLQAFIPKTGENLPYLFARYDSAPSGGLIATASDMARYMIALLGNDRSGTITEEMRRDIFAVQRQNAGRTAVHGIIFELNPLGSKVLVQHSGALGPHRCFMAFAFEHNSGLFYCHTTWDVTVHKGANKPLPLMPTASAFFATLLSPGNPQALAPPPRGRTEWTSRWDGYLGSYLTMRRQHEGFGRLMTLLDEGTIKVRHTQAGLMIGGDGPARELSPGIFAAGLSVVAFTPDPTSPRMIMTTNIAPGGFERVRWLDDPAIAMAVLTALLAAGLTGFLYPVWARGGARRSRMGLGGALLLAVAVGAPPAILYASGSVDHSYLWGVLWPVRTSQAFAALTLPAAVLLWWAVLSGPAHPTTWWSWIGRGHLAALAVVSVLSLAMYDFVGMFSAYVN